MLLVIVDQLGTHSQKKIGSKLSNTFLEKICIKLFLREKIVMTVMRKLGVGIG